MTPDPDPATAGDRPGTGELEVALDRGLPPTIHAGTRIVPLLVGTCAAAGEAVTGLEIGVDGRFCPAESSGLPRVDRADGAYRSGFWTNLPIAGGSPGERVRIEARATGSDGIVRTAELGEIEVVPAPDRPPGDPEIAVAMATYNPDRELFVRQIESIRHQTVRDWVCVISDDRSDPEAREFIERQIEGDDRFRFDPSPERLGFYRNFERALTMVPAGTALVALSDQDDHWHPDKLEALRDALADRSLAYSDQRLVDRDGALVSETFWVGRRNNSSDFRSMLVANTVTGAASMFRADLLDLLLPFPDPPGWQFHDQWIAAAAMATGDLGYVDRPLYDYVQHAGAILGQVSGDSAPRGRFGGLRERVGEWRGFSVGWRAAYFYDYLRIQNQAELILYRGGDRVRPDRRRVLRWFAAADRGWTAAFRLLLRSLRPLAGRDETLGVETQLTRGLLWRRLVELRAGRVRDAPAAGSPDAGLPAVAPTDYGSQRLRRWRSGR